MQLGLQPTSGETALAAAGRFAAGLAVGPLATSVAVLAVGVVGFLLLTGRVPVRRAARVMLGCFVLFGASGIASAVLGLVERDAGSAVLAENYQPMTPVPVPAVPPAALQYDPYAGASVPVR